MEIIGHGMMARSLYPFRDEVEDSVIFASGVANSLSENRDEYKRELRLLYQTVKTCRAEGRRIVYFSSCGAVYENSEGIKDESSPLFPLTMYGQHKLLCESIISHSGAGYLILRLTNVVGRGQNRHQLIPALVTQAIEGYAKIYGNARRDLVDAQDVGNILVSLLKKVDKSMIINFASGHPIPVIDIFSEIQDILGTNARIDLLSGGNIHQFSISRIQSYLGDEINFLPDYWRSVIRKYISIDWNNP